jgi:hypothetical protein
MPQGTSRHAVRIRHGSKVLDCTGEQARRNEEPRDWDIGTALELTEHNVKVRLHRGRAMARGWLCERGANAKRLSLDLERQASGLMTCSSATTESTHHFNTIADLVIVVGFFRDQWDFKKIVG